MRGTARVSSAVRCDAAATAAAASQDPVLERAMEYLLDEALPLCLLLLPPHYITDGQRPVVDAQQRLPQGGHVLVQGSLSARVTPVRALEAATRAQPVPAMCAS